MRTMILIAGVWLAAGVALAQAPVMTMTCKPVAAGNAFGPQVYRVVGVELIKTDPALSEPIIMSSAVKRQALERVVERGKAVLTSASHRMRGPVLTRTIFWTDAAGVVTKTLTETYDFRAKTISRPTGSVERCR